MRWLYIGYFVASGVRTESSRDALLTADRSVNLVDLGDGREALVGCIDSKEQLSSSHCRTSKAVVLRTMTLVLCEKVAKDERGSEYVPGPGGMSPVRMSTVSMPSDLRTLPASQLLRLLMFASGFFGS